MFPLALLDASLDWTHPTSRWPSAAHAPPERPAGLGLVVPGMPIGSPGMEQPGGEREPFQTLLLLDRTRRTRPFANHD